MDAVDARIQGVVDKAFQTGLQSALQVIKRHIDDVVVEGIAEAAVELAVDVAKHEVVRALEGSGRVDVSGDVPVVIKVH